MRLQLLIIGTCALLLAGNGAAKNDVSTLPPGKTPLISKNLFGGMDQFASADSCDGETVSTPDPPNGPDTAVEDCPIIFYATGAESSCGHELQYRFNWGDGSISAWSTLDSVSHTWIKENTYNVIVKARCRIHPEVEANWSSMIVVTITASDKDSGALSFGDPISFPVDADPNCVRFADFDNDGLPDLVSINKGAGTVSILLGNGNLTFGDAYSFPVGSGAGDVAIGNFDGNDFPDLAVACRNEDSISVFLNNGDGTFASAASYLASHSAGSYTERPLHIASGDFNGDGFDDIIVAPSNEAWDAVPSDRLHGLMNTGDGSFTNAFTMDLNQNGHQDVSGVCTGDFDLNGYVDIAASLHSGTVFVYYNTDMAFTRASFATGPYFEDIRADDLDGDGDLDFSLFGIDWDYRDVITMQNNGSGNFSVRSTQSAIGATSIYAADMDADDDRDIIMTSSQIMVYPNGGSANLSGPVSVFSGGNPKSVCAADFDGDGDNDLAIANTLIDVVMILPNTIGETPREELFYPYVWSGQDAEVYDLITADFDGDSLDDLAYSSFKILTGTPATNFRERITIMLRGVDDKLQNGPTIDWDNARNWYNEDANPWFNLCAGDFNGDSAIDVGGSLLSQTLFALNQGSGTFENEVTFGITLGKMCAADLNLDGSDEFIVGNGNVNVFPSNGNGTFGDPVVYSLDGSTKDMVSSDINNDGADDVIVATTSLSVYTSDGNGTLAMPEINLEGGGTGVCLGDFNNDGWLDIATCGGAALISIWFNNGDGTFADPLDYLAGGPAKDICAIDINDDGWLDLAVINDVVYEVLLYINDGSGGFSYQNKYPVGRDPRALCAVDFDTDGDMDLVVACHGGFVFYNERGGLSILYNNLYDNTAIDEDADNPAIPPTFTLSQNRPNPFNPTTTISYSLPEATDVSVSLFNILGQKIATLVDTHQLAGQYSITWDGRNESGREVASGIYFYRFIAGNFVAARKMMLIK